MEEIRGYKHNPEMKNDEDFKEYESLVTRENNTDKEYKRIGELANKLIDKYGSLPGGETVRRGEVKYKEEPKEEVEVKEEVKTPSTYKGHLEEEDPPKTDITEEDVERFGKEALKGLSGKKAWEEEDEELSAYTKDLEDYLDKNPDAKKKNYY